jgi:hypothetical protein
VELAKNIWDKSQHLIVLYSYSTIDELLSLKEAVKFVFAKDRVKTPQVIVFLRSKKDLTHVPTLKGFTYLVLSEFSMFGKLKNEQVKKLLETQFDLLLCVNDQPKKITKWMDVQFQHVQKAGVNLSSTASHVDINLNSKQKSLKELINFTKDTLQHIG